MLVYASKVVHKILMRYRTFFHRPYIRCIDLLEGLFKKILYSVPQIETMELYAF
jgi:hypothetical protein